MAISSMRIFFDKNTLQFIRKEAWEGGDTPELKQIEIDSGILAENEDMVPLTDPAEINNALTATATTISGVPGNYSLAHDFTPLPLTVKQTAAKGIDDLLLAEFLNVTKVEDITDKMIDDYVTNNPLDKVLVRKLFKLIAYLIKYNK